MAQIQKKVITFTKRNQDGMAEETKIQPSLAVEDMKEYLEQVVREVKKNPTSTEMIQAICMRDRVKYHKAK